MKSQVQNDKRTSHWDYFQLSGPRQYVINEITAIPRVGSDSRTCQAPFQWSMHTPSIAFRHLPPKKDVVNQRMEFVVDVIQATNGMKIPTSSR